MRKAEGTVCRAERFDASVEWFGLGDGGLTRTMELSSCALDFWARRTGIFIAHVGFLDGRRFFIVRVGLLDTHVEFVELEPPSAELHLVRPPRGRPLSVPTTAILPRRRYVTARSDLDILRYHRRSVQPLRTPRAPYVILPPQWMRKGDIGAAPSTAFDRMGCVVACPW